MGTSVIGYTYMMTNVLLQLLNNMVVQCTLNRQSNFMKLVQDQVVLYLKGYGDVMDKQFGRVFTVTDSFTINRLKDLTNQVKLLPSV